MEPVILSGRRHAAEALNATLSELETELALFTENLQKIATHFRAAVTHTQRGELEAAVEQLSLGCDAEDELIGECEHGTLLAERLELDEELDTYVCKHWPERLAKARERAHSQQSEARDAREQFKLASKYIAFLDELLEQREHDNHDEDQEERFTVMLNDIRNECENEEWFATSLAFCAGMLSGEAMRLSVGPHRTRLATLAITTLRCAGIELDEHATATLHGITPTEH